MPTLIKGIISSVTDPLLTLTATGANDQGSALTLWKNLFLVTVVASESFPADPASDQFQSMPINSLSCCLHTSTPPPLSHDFSAAAPPQCSRQRQRHSTDWCRCAGATGCRLKAPARHARESSRRGVDCAACSPLFHLGVLYNADVLLVSGTDGNYHADPSGPASALWDPVVIGAGGLWSLLSSRRFMRFSLGLRRPRQRANCGVVARANRTPHVSAFVGGQWPNS